MQSFVPPVVLRNDEPWNCRRRIHHLRDFLLERHTRDQIVNALFKWEFWIEVRRARIGFGCLSRCGRNDEQQAKHDCDHTKACAKYGHGCSLILLISVTLYWRVYQI